MWSKMEEWQCRVLMRKMSIMLRGVYMRLRSKKILFKVLFLIKIFENYKNLLNVAKKNQNDFYQITNFYIFSSSPCSTCL
jgi:hypothetical protein